MLTRVGQKCSLVASTAKCLVSSNRTTCHQFSLGEIKKPVYAQQYPVLLVKPDGSTIRIKYHEPLSIINLPLDLNTLEEVDRKRRLLKVAKIKFLKKIYFSGLIFKCLLIFSL